MSNTIVPTEYGGPGLSDVMNVLAGEAINYGCAAIGTAILANTLAGNEAQKKEYFGRMLSEPIAAVRLLKHL